MSLNHFKINLFFSEKYFFKNNISLNEMVLDIILKMYVKFSINYIYSLNYLLLNYIYSLNYFTISLNYISLNCLRSYVL